MRGCHPGPGIDCPTRPITEAQSILAGCVVNESSCNGREVLTAILRAGAQRLPPSSDLAMRHQVAEIRKCNWFHCKSAMHFIGEECNSLLYKSEELAGRGSTHAVIVLRHL